MNKIAIVDNCKFYLGDCPDAWQAWYDDCNWKDVTLPHDWSVSLPFSKDYSSGTGYLAGGIGWYRIHIKPQKSWIGKRISIAFDGVYKNSKVWCNSYYLGNRPNGYISFYYDITNQFNFDAENIIAVQVDHHDISDSRWFTGSGITRKVSLVIEEPVHIVHAGVFFSTPQVSKEYANFQIVNEIINTENTNIHITVTNKIIDKNIVVSSSASSDLNANTQKTFNTCGTIQMPQLWSTDCPYLYTLETWISIKQNDTTIEYIADSKKVGIRSIHFDPNEGFYLNGVNTILKGVCLHHDAGCLGAAASPAVWRRRLQKLKAMGCNAIRMSHNPHMPELYDLCDSMGFLVIDEIFDEWEAPKNKWSTGHNVYPPKHQGYYIDFPQWHQKDITDLVRRDYCHPSIIMWSIGNEIDYPNDPYCHPSFNTMTGNNDANKPVQEREYNPKRPNAKRLAILSRNLTQIVKQNDTTRPVTLAAAFPELSTKLGFIDPIDVVGYNYKEHLYQQSHEQFPNKPFIGSENSHSLNAWKAVTDNPYISGQFLWTGIDYLGEAHGWPIHGSMAGLMTLAGFEKPWYYRRQSFWSNKPMIYIATAYASTDVGEFTPVYNLWNYPNGEEVLIKCYTNLKEVEFFINNRSIGTFSKEDKDCICLNLPFEAGTLEAKGIDNSGKTISCSLSTVNTACQIQLKCWEDWEVNDLYQIEVTLLDNENRPVYSNSSILNVEVENGKLLGIENGDLSDITDYFANYRRAYHGQLLIYIKPEDKSQAMVTVKGENLKPAILYLNKKR